MSNQQDLDHAASSAATVTRSSSASVAANSSRGAKNCVSGFAVLVVQPFDSLPCEAATVERRILGIENEVYV